MYKPILKLAMILGGLALTLLVGKDTFMARAAPVLATQTDWHKLVIDYAGGYYTSIAVDKSDNVHISYLDSTGNLKYATNSSGEWITSTITTLNNHFHNTSIATDSKGKVYIAYTNSSYMANVAVRDINGTWTITGSVMGDHSWYETVAWVSIAVDNNDTVHLAGITLVPAQYPLPYGSAYIYYSNNAGGQFQRGNDLSFCMSSSNNLSSPSITTDSKSKIYIAYIDLDSNQRDYLTNATGIWRCHFLGGSVQPFLYSNRYIAVDNADTLHIVGDSPLDYSGGLYYASIALDRQNYSHVMDYSNGLRYITDSPLEQHASSTAIFIDYDMTNTVGEYNSIAVDSKGNSHAAYFDRTNVTLKYAYYHQAMSYHAYVPVAFTPIGSPPAAPVLSAISNPGGASNYNVSWGAVAQAISYTLQEDTNSAFPNAVTRYTGTAISWPASGKAAGTYYYRVSATNNAGTSGWSNVQSVTVTAMAPAAPVLSAISNSSGASSYNASWGAVAQAISYTLQEDTNSAFPNAVTRYTGTAISWSASGKAVGTYYYRVSATNDAGTSNWSNVQSTTVNALSRTPGYWASTTGDEFYVTPDVAYVKNFAIYLGGTCAGNIKITHTTLQMITNNQFSFTGTFYASGTFDSATAAHGTDGLSYFNIGCGTISGGPWAWSATWQNSTQPAVTTALETGIDGVTRPVTVTLTHGTHAMIRDGAMKLAK